LALIVAVVTLVTSAIIVHVGCSSHVRSHCEITEGLRVLLRISSALWIALALCILALSRRSLVVVLIIVVVVLVLATMLLALVVTSIMLVWVVRIGIVVAPVSLLVLRPYFFDSKSSRFIIISITAALLMSLLITTIMVVVLLVLVIRIRIALLMAVAVVVMTLLRVSRHDCVLKGSPAEMRSALVQIGRANLLW
jgi:hypothetical protein